MVKDGRLASRGNRQIWTCPCCGRTLGEVYSGRVVVKAGDRYITFPVQAEVTQTCSRCGEDSTLSKQEYAA